MSRHIFISYQRTNIDVAETIAGELMAAGFPVFIDRQIRIGEPWNKALEEALEAAFAVVVLWSNESIRSDYVQLEARFGLQRRILRPALISDCTLPSEFSAIECADLRKRLPGDARHPEWWLLLSSLHQLRNPSPTDNVSTAAKTAFLLGMKFWEGKNCPQDAGIALSWFEKSKAAGHPQAAEMIRKIRNG